MTEWNPALEGFREKLERGGHVADVGCGYGASTILMAQAFPNSRFYGSHYHEASIEHARRSAERAGVGDRVVFETAGAQSFSGGDFDLVCIFDGLHDMGDPVGAAAHARQAMAPDGTWMIVEPNAADRLEDNLNPFGRVFHSASTATCHAERGVAGRRPGARCASRRGAAACRARRGRLQPGPPRGRNAVQPGARGTPVAASVPGGPAAAVRARRRRGTSQAAPPRARARCSAR